MISLLRSVWILLRCQALDVGHARREAPNELARFNEVLDAWLEGDGMDATGL